MRVTIATVLHPAGGGFHPIWVCGFCGVRDDDVGRRTKVYRQLALGVPQEQSFQSDGS